MELRAAYPCLCVGDVRTSVAFYRSLLGLVVSADVGWYAELSEPERSSNIVLAVVDHEHGSVPTAHRRRAGGVLLSFVIDDIAPIRDRAQALGIELALEPCDESFGQRHFMAVDPDGCLIDVIERIPMAASFRRQLVAGRRAWR